MALKRQVIFICFLLGCVAPRRPHVGTGGEGLTQPPSFPTRSCREAWDRLPPGQGQYDFKSDHDYKGYAARVDRKHCYKKWTLLLYMAADNDLNPYAYLDLYEMEAAGDGVTASGQDTDVIVQLDSRGNTGLRRLHMFQTGEAYDAALTPEDFARRSDKDIRSPVVDLLPEKDPGDPAADLKHFLTWGIAEYPSEHYLVVVWGHGEGWGLAQRQVQERGPDPRDPIGNGRLVGGLAFNFNHLTYLGVPTLRDTLGAVVKESLLGQKIDIYASDACLMQSIEVATELSDTARYIAGSTQVEDFLGMSYRGLLARLNAGEYGDPGCQGRKDAEACAVARLIPQVYKDSLSRGLRQKLSGNAPETFTLSVLRTDDLHDALLPALSRFGQVMTAYLSENRFHPGQIGVVASDRGTPSFRGNYRDLSVSLFGIEGQLGKDPQVIKNRCQLTPSGTELEKAIAAAREALDRAVVSVTYGTRYPTSTPAPLGTCPAPAPDPRFRAFSGLSVWLPMDPQDYRGRVADFIPSALFQYDKLPAAQMGPWHAWLDLLYSKLP